MGKIKNMPIGNQTFGVNFKPISQIAPGINKVKPMPAIPPVEIEKRLKKLEVQPAASTDTIKKVGDQYEYDKDFIYLAYASALANLSSGSITNQSDASDFQFTPYNTSGTLMAYRGYFINKSIYQSGDPTDYTWEATSGTAGYTSSERYYSEATGLLKDLGNPTNPGTNITWTSVTAGTAIPSSAVYSAERFTLTTTSGAVTSAWDIKAVGKYVNENLVTANGIKAENIDLDGTLSVTANSGAIRWGKTDGDDVDNSGLFIGRNSSGSPRFVIGSPSSFIYYNGTTGVVSAIGVSSSATTGEEENFFTDTSQTHVLNLSPLVDEINIQMVGAGGGGGRNGTSDGSTPASTDGGASIVKVVQSNGSVRATYTAAGGQRGLPASGGGGGGSFAAGQNGGSFAHPGGSNHSSFVGTGGTGGAYNTNNAGGDGGTGSGGGGQGQGGGGSAADGGAGGAAGTFYTTTLLKSSGHYVSTDHLEITVGLAGVGQYHKSGNTPHVKAGGHGGAGRVRIKGEDT